MSKTVLVYRKHLLPLSETFIPAQGYHLPSFRPVFVGQRYHDKGLNHLRADDCCVLSDHVGKWWGKAQLKLGHVDRRWLKALSAFEPAIMHAHFAKDGISAMPIAKALGIPLVVTLHGHDITKYKNTQPSANLVDLFGFVDKVIAVSDFIAEQAISAGCPEEKIVQHYIGIDVEQFTASDMVKKDHSIIFVGRLVAKKGCMDLLQAAQRLQQKVSDLSITIVGDGPLRSELENFAQQAQLPVEFLGALPPESVKQKVARASVFCVPSNRAKSGDAEGLGMVFLEAQALHTPVVSYASGGVPEAVENGITGLLVKEYDHRQLAEAIEALLTDTAIRKRFMTAGRERVERQFDIRKQSKALEAIYQDVIHAT